MAASNLSSLSKPQLGFSHSFTNAYRKRAPMFNSVSIIGTGHCGCALAVDTLSRGLGVLLYAHPEHARNLNAIAQQGYLNSAMQIEGQFKPRLTQNIAEAVKFSKCLIITTPSFGHDTIVNELKSFDLSDHVLVVINANFFSLAYMNELNARLILETNAAPYASRFVDGEILVLGIKKNLQIAAYPADISADDRNAVASVFSMSLEWQDNVLDVGLQSNNGVFHPATTILNTARIELTKGDFYFYKDGISTSVGRIIESVDQERLAIANAFGYRPQTLLSEMISFYGGEYKSFSDFACHSAVHNRTKNTPSSMAERYITEDVPFIMVPWHELGRVAGIQAPTMRSIIEFSSIINNENYFLHGRNARKLKIENLSIEDVIRIIKGGNFTTENRQTHAA